MCLQEIKADASQIPGALFGLDGYWCYWHGTKGYSGVALHVLESAAAERPLCTHPAFDYEHRIVTSGIGDLVVASIYVPNGGKDFPAKMRFLEALDVWARELHAGGRQVILCGDLNVARADIDVHPKERKPNAIGQLPEERALFDRLLDGGLVDVGRTLAPEDDQLFTWWPPWRNMRARNIGWRIDYVLASAALAERAVACEVRTAIGTSDHAPVVATFA